jgi:hypothetical protein
MEFINQVSGSQWGWGHFPPVSNMASMASSESSINCGFVAGRSICKNGAFSSKPCLIVRKLFCKNYDMFQWFFYGKNVDIVYEMGLRLSLEVS